MANALKMTLYGTLGNRQMVPLTDAELISFVNAQNCSPMQKHIITTALSLVGKVPYFWGRQVGARLERCLEHAAAGDVSRFSDDRHDSALRS